MLLHPPDYRRSHGLADCQPAVDKLYLHGATHFHNADLLFYLGDGIFRAEIRAGATAMAELREYQNTIFQYRQGIIGADLSTFATIGTLPLIDLGDRNGNRLPPLDSRLE